MMKIIDNKIKLLIGLFALLVNGIWTIPVKGQISASSLVQWQQTLDEVLDPDLQVVQATNGGYALLNAGRIYRFDESGAKLWETRVSALDNFPTYPNAAMLVQPVSNGKFIVLARSSIKWSLAKLDAAGKVEWLKAFDDVEHNQTIASRDFTSLLITSDGSIVATTLLQRGRNGAITEVYKFNSQGDKTLYKTISNDAVRPLHGSTATNQIIQTIDGNYLVVGGATDANSQFKAWAAKLNQQLEPVWKRNFDKRPIVSVVNNPLLPGTFVATVEQENGTANAIVISALGALGNELNLTGQLQQTQTLLSLTKKSLGYSLADVTISNSKMAIRLQSFGLLGLLPSNSTKLVELLDSSYRTIKSVVQSSDGGVLIVGRTLISHGPHVQDQVYTPWLLKLKP